MANEKLKAMLFMMSKGKKQMATETKASNSGDATDFGNTDKSNAGASNDTGGKDKNSIKVEPDADENGGKSDKDEDDTSRAFKKKSTFGTKKEVNK
jgi:hypothetical protein